MAVWSNARMYRGIDPLEASMKLNAHLRALLDNVMLASMPRAYQVRWLDDEMGWRCMTVVTRSAEEAIATVAPLAGTSEIRAYPCAI